jgi:hypothetical protein
VSARTIVRSDEEVLTDYHRKVQVNEGFVAAFYAERFAKYSNGEPYDIDYALLREAMAVRLVEDPPTSKREKKVKGATQTGLTRAVFPHTAPDEDEDLVPNSIEALVWAELEAEVWRQANPRWNSPFSKLLKSLQPPTDDGPKWSLVKTTVSMGNGLKAVTTEIVYVTTDWTMLRPDYVSTLKDKMASAASEYAKALGDLQDRNLALAERLKRELDAGMGQATKVAQNTLALHAGSDDEE